MTRPRHEYELWLCDDCTIAEVNGDYSGMDDERAEEVAAGIERLVAEVGPLSANWSSGDSETDWGIKDFSWRPCDACRTGLAGSRHRFAAWGRAGRVSESQSPRRIALKSERRENRFWGGGPARTVWVIYDVDTGDTISASTDEQAERARFRYYTSGEVFDGGVTYIDASGGSRVGEASRRGAGRLTRSTARPGTPVRVADPDSMYRGMTGTVVTPDARRLAALDDYNKRFLRGEGAVLVETQRGELFVIHARALERLGTAITRAMDRDSRRTSARKAR